MDHYLIINNEIVENVIVWDGVSPWSPPDGTTVEPAPVGVGRGWRRVDGQWVAPEPLAAPAEDQSKTSARTKLAALGLTDEEIAALIK